jgi:hypothetical protein
VNCSRARLLPLAAVATAALVFSPIGGYAHADSGSDPMKAVEKAFPGYADRDDASGTISDLDSQALSEGSAFILDPAEQDIPSFNLSLPQRAATGETAEDYSVYRNSAGDGSTLVRADSAGASIVEVNDNPGDGLVSQFTFEDTIANYFENGYGDTVVVLESDESVVLRDANAIDSNGSQVETATKVEGDTVSIHLDPDSVSGDGPVVSVFGFQYIMDFDIGYTDPASASEGLKRPGMFGKLFSIDGAPDDFPAVGDLLPLRMVFDADFSNFECYFLGDTFISGGTGYPDEWNFELEAGPNHIDGEGSYIRFITTGQPESETGNNPDNKLSVYAEIINDAPGGVPESVYKFGARAKWNEFAKGLAWLTLWGNG